MAKALKRAWKRHSIAPPFVKSGGVSFSYRHQTWYINCSFQDGQLSNSQSSATINRKSAILIWMCIFEILQLWINEYSSQGKYTIHTKRCLHEEKTSRNLNCEQILVSLNGFVVVNFWNDSKKGNINCLVCLNCSFQTLQSICSYRDQIILRKYA